ncbi:hypothetical protein GALL_483620 [mine drainage metagenome]|uniref:Uncharacterized protein n=1 Tax=mine drainage metagenome TaxID=410659 RepID=A0A1J5Q2D1_9ZZZZ
MVNQLIGIKTRSPEQVKVICMQRVGGQQHQCVKHPAGVGRAARHVDDRQAAARDKVSPQQTALVLIFIL